MPIFQSRFIHSLFCAAIALSASFAAVGAEPVSVPEKTSRQSKAEVARVAQTVGRILEQGHYTRQQLDDAMSEKIFDNYIRMLDYNRLYFTQKDIDEFRARYEDSLDDTLLRGDLSPAEDIFKRFEKRVEDRVAKNKVLAGKEFAFDTDETIELNRDEAAWPSDEAAADALWRKRITAELLQEELSDTRLDSPEVTITRRYDQVLRNIHEQEYEDIMNTYLSAVTQAYDPHSSYLSPRDMENFEISMRLSLVGVGAVLRSEDGYAKVVEVVPGGPADKEGSLQANDRIAGVAQGDEEFNDVVGMKLDKVVDQIRGKKGTTVRLLVAPSNAGDPSARKVITIVRDEVKLKDQEAKAELIELPAGDDMPAAKIGWITLPSFYANMNRDGKGAPKSTTEDVSRLLERLEKEGIEGLVIDLRKDGGGSLEEAIKLTSCFVPPGPIVQSKDSTGFVRVSNHKGNQVYTGPLIVLVNRLSASASEIFAAALQDYGRAIIVGDERSFGKGTVQQLVDVSRYMPFFSLAGSDAGAIKLTVQKFYRVSGGSTQLKGVESDIVLPSITDTDEIGEGALLNPLQYDEVDRQLSDESTTLNLFLPALKARSAQRVQLEPEFQFILEDSQRLNKRLEENKLSLNREKREAEIEEDKKRVETRGEVREKRGPALEAIAYELTLDNVDSPELVEVPFDREPKKSLYDVESGEVVEPIDGTPLAEDSKDDKTAKTEEGEKSKAEEDKPIAPDAIRNETLLIMRDLIDLKNTTKMAKTNPEVAEKQ
ncbi:MAG: carboxy terminal-processing peptidase [Chthoniobacterales bacterium]